MQKLQIKNYKKSYKGNLVFQNINLTLEHSNILVIIGDSGSGKSTLLECICLLEKPDSGSITIDNQSIDFSESNLIKKKQLKSIENKIGMVFQDYNLWPHMSVLENLIEAPMKVSLESKDKAKARAIKMLDELGIQDKANEMPENLSGGQKQRVAIARSLMMKPEIILFDEPSSALDPKMVNVLVKILKKLAKDGISIILSTHKIPFAKQIANRVLFLHKKMIIEEGESEILNHPKTNELKQFLNTEKNEFI